jgi:hypothetical protein
VWSIYKQIAYNCVPYCPVHHMYTHLKIGLTLQQIYPDKCYSRTIPDRLILPYGYLHYEFGSTRPRNTSLTRGLHTWRDVACQ